MPETAKKTAAQKAQPAVRARRDARTSGAKAKPYEVKWRGETFEVTPDRLGSAPVYYANMRVQQASGDVADTLRNLSDLVFKILGTADQERWLNLVNYDDNPAEVAGEFLTALNKATNVPNS